MIFVALFWLCIACMLYVYFFYPVILRILAELFPFKIRRGDELKEITMIIPAYNEAKIIEDKLKNTLRLDYPSEKMKVIVASDASDDGTDELAEKYADKGIRLFRQERRQGKSAMLNKLIPAENSEIIVLTDATTLLEPDALKKIIRNFNDDRVGAVCGQLKYTNFDESLISENESIYWKYEEFLKEQEGRLGRLLFVSGPFYAIRKNLWTYVEPYQPDDSVSPLQVNRKGYRVVYEKEATAYERSASTAAGEIKIKSRGAMRELSSILSNAVLLNPFRYPVHSWILASHRLLRWMIPFLLPTVFLLNVRLIGQNFYNFTMAFQVLFYTAALITELRVTKSRFLKIPYYFCVVNLGAALGVMKALQGQKKPTWEPVR